MTSRRTRSATSFWSPKLGFGVGIVLFALMMLLDVAGRRADPASRATGQETSPRGPTGEGSSDSKPVKFEQAVQPLIRKYCFKCHGAEEQNGEIAFEAFRTHDDVLADRATWTKTLKMLTSGMMPPEDVAQPTAAERQSLVAWLDAALHEVNCELGPDPGRVTVRRLNRAEYDNTIRDLIGVDLKLSQNFPSDDVGEGFDNIGDVLSISPLLMEKYIDAAEQIAAVAIVAYDPSQAPKQRREQRELSTTGSANLREYGVFHMYSSGSVFADFEIPRDGEYLLRAEAGADQAGPEPAKIGITVDRENVKTIDVKARSDDLAVYEFRLPLKKGKRRIDAAFINDYYKPDAPDPNDRDRNLYVRFLELVGPLDLDPADIPQTHQRIVTARPLKDKSVQAAAREVLKPLVQRAFRRPVEDDEVAKYVALVELAVGHGDTYERGIQVAVTALLVSPQFLFRVEQDPDPNDPRAKHALGDFELATRMSYFLWSSMPDDELFRLAAQEKLHEDDVIEQQVRRMIADPKSRALADNFAAQWLNLRMLDEMSPDPGKFKEFDDQLRADMREETLRFFDAVMREDRDLGDFIDGDFSFLNQRLARFYGVDGVEGDQFRKVELAGGRRAGVMTQASILTLTSNPTRTSPVKRGKWIMENILGTPPPDPPAGVPDLAETQKASPDATLREQLEIHRKDASCAVCHREMDVLGFGFENFDAIGRWRDRDEKSAIDATGRLPSGDSFDGPAELIGILGKRKAEFCRSLTEKMLTYALGRGLAYYDRCAVDDVMRALQNNEYRFSTLVIEIVKSEPFRMRRGDGGER